MPLLLCLSGVAVVLGNMGGWSWGGGCGWRGGNIWMAGGGCGGGGGGWGYEEWDGRVQGVVGCKQLGVLRPVNQYGYRRE